MKTIHLLEFYINFRAQAERDNFIHSQIRGVVGGGRYLLFDEQRKKSRFF